MIVNVLIGNPYAIAVFTHVREKIERTACVMIKDRDGEKRDREIGRSGKPPTKSGSKAEGEDVPRQIIDCIRRVSIPPADCTAKVLPRKASSGLYNAMYIYVIYVCVRNVYIDVRYIHT